MRMAERYHGVSIFHVVRTPERYGCGAHRHPERVNEDCPAHEVQAQQRCSRVGCWNDYRAAEAEAREASAENG